MINMLRVLMEIDNVQEKIGNVGRKVKAIRKKSKGNARNKKLRKL